MRSGQEASVMSDNILKRLKLTGTALRPKDDTLQDYFEDDAFVEPITQKDPKMLRILSERVKSRNA